MMKKARNYYLIGFMIMILVCSGCGGTAGIVKGQVTDASSGTGITGVIVSAGGEVAATDNYGNYTISNVPVGTLNVTAVRNGYDGTSAAINVGPQEEITQNLKLSQVASKGIIAGQVIDVSSGLGIDGAVVSVGGQSTFTSDGGTYTLRDVPLETQPITVMHSGYSDASDEVTVTEGETVTKNLSLTPAR